jgi:plastocyanin
LREKLPPATAVAVATGEVKMLRRRWLVGCALTPIVGMMIAVPVTGGTAAADGNARAATPGGHTAAAAAPPVVIGVDHTPPAGKNWEYTHYFPETGVSVPQGGLVLFHWSGIPGVVHTVTFVPANSTEAAVRLADPTIVADSDNGESGTIIAPPTVLGTRAKCGNSPAAPPCVFDGTSVVSSGVIPTVAGAFFPVQIAASTAPGTYHYICLIHPNMSGTLTVVPAAQPATSAGGIAAQASAEFNQLSAGAAAAEAAAEVPTSTVNPDGSRTWTVKVGLTVADVEINEFLPPSVPIRKGDSVNFDGAGTTQEPHTVTSFAGFNAGYGFFGTNQCEVTSGPDTDAKQINGPPEAGCTDPTTIELAVNITNQGEQNAISSGRTATSDYVSGRADTQALGGSTAHTYKFPANGFFPLACSIHANMFGVVQTPGYRLASSTGAVSTFGASDSFGAKTTGLTSPVVASPYTSADQGYWLVTADGHTYNFGSAANVGNIGRHNGSPIVGAVSTSDDGGLWLVAKDGRVYALGDATFMGDMGGVKLGAPIVGIASDGSNGYDLVGADGGVLTFGTSGNGNGGPRFFGSLGATHLNKPIVGIADTLSGNGYYLVASDGGVFTFGDATFVGSLGATKLNAPIVAMAPSFDLLHAGYTLVAADGGVFTFGSARFLGSAAPAHPPNSIVAIN